MLTLYKVPELHNQLMCVGTGRILCALGAGSWQKYVLCMQHAAPLVVTEDAVFLGTRQWER
jgi:hypothetical protein